MGLYKKKKNQQNDLNSKPKTKTKLSHKQIVNTICIILLSTTLICGVVGFTVLQGILNNSKLVSGIDGLEAANSSRIFAANGELITTLSGESGVRENIKYEQIPQVVIDAFLSIEDSRYYKHNGFDLPRFISSAFNNISSGGLNQGGSTLTMQLVDVALFSDEDKANATAVDKINQKVQEIFKSMEIESELDKEKIIENYLNMINFGGSARGIQKGAQYYFGKDVEDLNLSEAAFLAGVINAPTTFNPYNGTYNGVNYYENATSRRNTVLNMMKYHGYITETECELAKNSELAFQLNGVTNFDTESYKSFVDYVVEEVKDKTGDNPYTTPMDIYTTMDKESQELSDKLCNGEGVSYPDERFQTGFAVMNNQTGAILALGGGRSYTGERNRAYVDSHQPGSTAKPILEYAQAFEYLGYSTEHVIEDGPVDDYANGTTLYNADRTFSGDVTLKEAIGRSLNVPAYKTCRAVIEKIGLSKELELLSDMGIDIKEEDWSYSMSIGGGNLYVTPLQMAAAYSVFANKGYYNEPYSVEKIQYQSDKKTAYEHKSEDQKIFSEETAYLTSYMLKDVVEGGYGTLADILRDSYPVYAKTGTTDYGEEALQYGYPEGVAKDKWMVAYTNNYTVSCWAGYDQAVVGQNNYLDQTKLFANVEGQIINALLDNLVSNDGGATAIAQPSGVVSIKHIQGLFPYATASNEDGSLMVSALINKKFAGSLETVSPDDLDTPSSISLTENTDRTLTIEMPLYPDEEKRKVASDTKTMSAGGVSVTGKLIFDKSFLFGSVKSCVEIKVNGKSMGTFDMDSNKMTKSISYSEGDKIEVIGYYTYTNADTKSSTKSVSLTARYGESKETTYKISSSFNSLFTNSYEQSRANVISYLQHNCPEAYNNGQFIIASSSNADSGHFDSAQSNISAGSTIVVGNNRYYIYIGE